MGYLEDREEARKEAAADRASTDRDWQTWENQPRNGRELAEDMQFELEVQRLRGTPPPEQFETNRFGRVTNFAEQWRAHVASAAV